MMLDSVKEVLTKDIELERIKQFLEMEIEIKRLKELLATEVRLKEFLLQEVNVKNLFPASNKDEEDSDEKKTADLFLIHDIKEAYDAELIQSLREDHEQLLFIYQEIVRNAELKKFTLVKVHLDTFHGLLTHHYQKADEHLYPYLDAFIRYKYPKREKAFHKLNTEMKKISISIFYSLSECMSFKLSNDNFYCFMCSFSKLGKQLNKRIDRESTLLLQMYEDSVSIHSRL